MSSRCYEALAQAFVAEGVERVFALMGDANMHWVTAMAAGGVECLHARHEHCACAMADGYARATGKVGVATVTCGPGFTQIMTALAIAARGNIPMVVFAGDSPTNSPWYVQQIDQAPLALATGARFIGVRHIDRALDAVREAFHTAQLERLPVVLSIPMDIQRQPCDWGSLYQPSSTTLPAQQRVHPDPALASRAAAWISGARSPVLIAGRGALRSGAREAMIALAGRTGALLATTLLAKGLFDDQPYSLGIAGAFASAAAREQFAGADLILGVGAGLGHFTTEAGYLSPNARVIQVDTAPRGLHQGLRTADLHVVADARAGIEAITLALGDGAGRGVRHPDLARCLAAAAARPDPKTFEVTPDTLDPRETMLELDAAVPRDWDIIVGGGHYFSIALTHLRGRAAERYHVINDFGAIGSGLSAAIGVAAARRDGKVLLVEGDGSLLMHVQELETIRRHGLKLLMATVNDGGYGAEVHKLRAQGLDPAQAMHGRGDLASIARGFGLRGERVVRPGTLAKLLHEHEAQDSATLWDLHVDDRIASAAYRRVHFGEDS